MREAKRSLIISDIQGCYREFIELLDLVKYEPSNDILLLLLLGDYVDRGEDSRAVVEQIMFMKQAGHVAILKGNHDQRFVDLLKMYGDIDFKKKFLQHGGGGEYPAELLWLPSRSP